MSGLNHDKLCCAAILVKKEAVNWYISFLLPEEFTSHRGVTTLKSSLIFGGNYTLNFVWMIRCMQERKVLLPNRPRIIENVVQKTACLSL
jgi:hypothetical protein